MSECPICMESIKEDEDILITKCKHKFHATCAFQNTKTNGYKCPNCRGSLLPAQANVITIQETQVDVSGNNINSIIEIINSRPYEPDPRFADVSSNNRRFMVVSEPRFRDIMCGQEHLSDIQNLADEQFAIADL